MEPDIKRIKILVDKLHHPNKDVRFEACEWLRALPVITPEAITALQEVINDPDEEVRHSARTALDAHSPSEVSVIQEIPNIEEVGKKTHSMVGIASIITSVVAVICINFLYALWSFSALLFWVIPILPLVALGLGIWGILQKNRKKLFAVLGIIIAILSGAYVWLIYLVLMII